MAVEIKYVVVRKGEEKMTFANKKEADAYDKMLDMAEVFTDWLDSAPLEMEETQREVLGLFLAENKEAVQHIMRTSKMPEAATGPKHYAVDAVNNDKVEEGEAPEASETAKPVKSSSRAGKAA